MGVIGAVAALEDEGSLLVLILVLALAEAPDALRAPDAPAAPAFLAVLDATAAQGAPEAPDAIEPAALVSGGLEERAFRALPDVPAVQGVFAGPAVPVAADGPAAPVELAASAAQHVLEGPAFLPALVGLSDAAGPPVRRVAAAPLLMACS